MTFMATSSFNWMELLNFYEKPFRAKLIPSKVWSDLDRYRNDSEGLANYFKKWRTKIVFKDSKLSEKYIAVGGEYGPEERQIELHIYTKNFNTHPFTDRYWNKFKYRLIQTHMHEIIHFMQFDRRDDCWSNYIVPYKKVGLAKKDAERKYLSEFDEIQAYAHCVYLDYKMRKPNVPIDKLLSRCKRKRDSITLHYFLKTFDYDFTNNTAPRKIIDQIGKWHRKYERLERAYKSPK